MTKKHQIFILSLVAILLTGCFSNKFEKDYKKACKEMEIPRSMCNCMIDKLNQEYGRKDLNEAFIHGRIDRIEFKKSFDRVGQKCFVKQVWKELN